MPRIVLWYARGRVVYLPRWKRNALLCLLFTLVVFAMLQVLMFALRDVRPRAVVALKPIEQRKVYEARTRAALTMMASNPAAAERMLEAEIASAKQSGILPLHLYPSDGEEALLEIYLRDNPNDGPQPEHEKYIAYIRTSYPSFLKTLKFEMEHAAPTTRP